MGQETSKKRENRENNRNPVSCPLKIEIISRRGEEYQYNFIFKNEEGGAVVEPHNGVFPNGRWRDTPVHEIYTVIQAIDRIDTISDWVTPESVTVRLSEPALLKVNHLLTRKPDEEITYIFLNALSNRNVFFEVFEVFEVFE